VLVVGTDARDVQDRRRGQARDLRGAPTCSTTLSPAPTVREAAALVPRRLRVSRMRAGSTGRNSAPPLLVPAGDVGQEVHAAGLVARPDLAVRPTLTTTTFGTGVPGRALMLLTVGGAPGPVGGGVHADVGARGGADGRHREHDRGRAGRGPGCSAGDVEVEELARAQAVVRAVPTAERVSRTRTGSAALKAEEAVGA
jgi:hypothetical protein